MTGILLATAGELACPVGRRRTPKAAAKSPRHNGVTPAPQPKNSAATSRQAGSKAWRRPAAAQNYAETRRTKQVTAKDACQAGAGSKAAQPAVKPAKKRRAKKNGESTPTGTAEAVRSKGFAA